MINIWIVLGILLWHWVADFICQTDWQAKNKSKNNEALINHTVVYTVVWLPFVFLFLDSSVYFYHFQAAGWFLLVTFICHTAQDYVTSRINSKLWAENNVHWFFVSIGFDQFLHYVQLLLTYYILTR